MSLSNSEEELMNHLWKLKKAFMKDLLEQYPEPKPASTTLATLLKRMKNKGVIGYTVHGKVRQYFPLIKKKDYFSKQVNTLIKNFFNNNTAQFASFFATETNLNKNQLEELKKLIDSEIKKKN